MWLDPGQKTRVTITVNPAASNHPLGTWDSAGQRWLTAPGTYQGLLGTSSTDLPLQGTVTVQPSARGR